MTQTASDNPHYVNRGTMQTETQLRADYEREVRAANNSVPGAHRRASDIYEQLQAIWANRRNGISVLAEGLGRRQRLAGRVMPNEPMNLQIVYQEVVETGPATAREISEGLGMPRSTVYRLLKQLEARGAIESEKYQRPDSVYIASPWNAR